MSFGDARLTLVHADAAEYVKGKARRAHDVVIVDSSDPVGPAETLFWSTFCALRGRCAPARHCNQGECDWLHLD